VEKYMYNSKEGDVETGYDYYGFRFYDTEINRFVSVDPLADKFPALTPYQYASNNPVLNIDLDGLEGVPAQLVNNVYTTARATTWLPSQNPALVNTPRLSDRSGNGIMLTSEAGQGQGSRAPEGNVQMVNIDGLLGAFQGAKARLELK
jgi:RHS repeat-associated protein